MATQKNTAPTATDEAIRFGARIDECYDILALLAGTRGILSEMIEEGSATGDTATHADRLLGQAMARLGRIVDEQTAVTNG